VTCVAARVWKIAGSGLLCLAAHAVLAGGAGAADCPGIETGFQRLASPQAEIAYRWEPAEPKVGEFFAGEVIACRLANAAALNEIVVQATMPAHGHGMNYRPITVRTGPDRFQVKGLMLHMPGQWRLSFDLYQGETRTRLTRDLNLKP
jgi:hypothetical protein